MTLDRLDGLNVACTRLIALAGLAALLIIAIATLADVGARWLADAPIAGVYDLSTLFIAVAMAACFPAAIASRQNIKVTFLADRLPRRAQLACDLFAEIMTLVERLQAENNAMAESIMHNRIAIFVLAILVLLNLVLVVLLAMR